MEKIYNPTDIEEQLYCYWESHDFFKPNNKKNNNNFCIIMPPPNVTGSLHMGHAFQHTIMDILVRYHRMQGDNTLWQMGLDHAGIATQMIVLKNMELKKNQSINDINRHEFIKKCWEWKKNISNNIYDQIKRLGNSIDWSRTRFTLDKIASKGVKKVFINLYNKNLIYRKKKISNWDIKLQTVISDLEVENRIISGKMWYIKYKILNVSHKKNINNYVTVATTRPETLLGDTAIAIHPNDIRYKSLLGKFVFVPIINRCIPIIADNFVDVKKGTGCVKITPAHDVNDYNVALRNKLPMINIFKKNGKISNLLEIYDTFGNPINIYEKSIPDVLKGLDRFQARKVIVQILQDMQLIDRVLEEKITVLYGDRSGSHIELLLTNQWYLRTELLAKKAVQVVLNKQIQFFPSQYKNMYLSWMNNIQDWCISRQLWWGHQIPVWYDTDGNIYVGKNEEHIRNKYHIKKDIILIQDQDVLDTWFSSSLWTFLSLDWPNKDNLLSIFHPTNVIVSGFDIIFFWIARMIMMTMYVMKDHSNLQIPFKHIYITGLIKDDNGKKMSKSKGNVLDPLDIVNGISFKELLRKRKMNNLKEILSKSIDYNTKKKFPNGIKSFGADVLRFTFASLSSVNRNINWDMNKLQGYRNFCNKLWNACRFIIINIKKNNIHSNNNRYLFFFNIWILSELNNTIKAFRYALDTYRFDIATNILYDFFWNKFCNWYLEIVKIVFKMNILNIINNTKYVLVYVFEIILKLLHPIIPFITEHLWQNIKNILNIHNKTIMLQSFPDFDIAEPHNVSLKIMQIIQEIIIFVRTIRTNFNIQYTSCMTIAIYNLSHQYKNIFIFYKNIFKKLACLKDIIFLDQKYHIKNNFLSKNIKNIQVNIIIDDYLDAKIKLVQLKKNIMEIDKKIQLVKKLLLDNKFVNLAKKEIIIKKKQQLGMLLLKRKKYIYNHNIYIGILNNN